MKKETPVQVFSCKFCEVFLSKPFFKEHLRRLLLKDHILNRILARVLSTPLLFHELLAVLHLFFFHEFHLISTISFTCDKKLTIFRNNLLPLTIVGFRFFIVLFCSVCYNYFSIFYKFSYTHLFFLKQRLFRQDLSCYSMA